MAAKSAQREQIELDLLLTGIARQWGYDFRGYAPASLRRRTRNAMRRERVGTLSALQERVLHDADAMGRFVEALSVNVTSLFRDPDFYSALRVHVVPRLRTYPFVRIWNAGCSTGEEVYSLAILLQEENLYERCRIYATDISDRAVSAARSGILPVEAVEKRREAYKSAGGQRQLEDYYLTDRKNAIFKKSLRQNVVFSQHNLAVDAAFNEFHLILCRNVMIYFGADLRARAQTLLHDSLVRFGVLGLGKRETLRFSHLKDLYEEISGDARLFRRVR